MTCDFPGCEENALFQVTMTPTSPVGVVQVSKNTCFKHLGSCIAASLTLGVPAEFIDSELVTVGRLL